MKKFWTTIASSRWKHIGGDYSIGLGADDNYCAAYTGSGVALERLTRIAVCGK